MSTSVTLIGRLGSDPELKFTNAGKGVASFSMVTNRNYKDDSGQWQEKETTWYRVTAWDAMAENVCESLTKGDSVIVVGRLFMDTYKDREGNERQSLKVEAYNIGVDLKKAQARPKRPERAKPQQQAPEQDPWNIPQDDMPPF